MKILTILTFSIVLYDISMSFMNYWFDWGKPRISLKTSAFPVSKETIYYYIFNLNKKIDIIGVNFILEIKYWIELNWSLFETLKFSHSYLLCSVLYSYSFYHIFPSRLNKTIWSCAILLFSVFRIAHLAIFPLHFCISP